MSKSFQKELPELIKAGIISPDTAERIESFYKEKASIEPRRLTIVLGILGALLVGLGIVLLVAHNWDDLPKLLKTALAFLPMAIGQGLCMYTLLRRKENIVWRETSAVLLFFGLASCIALMSQIYHIGGSLSDFLLTWMLLALPLIYIIPSSVVSLLYIGGITWYGCLVGYQLIYGSHSIIPYYYLLLLAAIIPHYYQLIKKDGNFLILHNWILVLSIVSVLGAFTPGVIGLPGNDNLFSIEMAVTGYLAFFCVSWLLGRTSHFVAVKLFANPFLIIGISGVLFILFLWSYDETWHVNDYGSPGKGHFFSFFYNYITLFFLSVIAFLTIVGRQSKNEWPDPVGFTVIILGICFWILPRKAGDFIDNCWVLLIAVWFIRKGALQNHLGILNFGLLIIAVLALLRFFDDSIPFFWRGLFFLAAGLGFFIANWAVIKRRKSIDKK